MSFFKSVLSCICNACKNVIGAVVSLVFPSSEVRDEGSYVANEHSLYDTSSYTGPCARPALYDYFKSKTVIHGPCIISK